MRIQILTVNGESLCLWCAVSYKACVTSHPSLAQGMLPWFLGHPEASGVLTCSLLGRAEPRPLDPSLAMLP